MQFESCLYPFRTVLRFNVRFDVVTLHKAKLGTLRNSIGITVKGLNPGVTVDRVV